MTASDTSLSGEQALVRDSDGGHLLVVAGPGTGKTRALTARILRLAAALGPGERILAVTYTNRAAGELSERLACAGEGLASRVDAGTFHAFALRLLARHTDQAAFFSARIAEGSTTVFEDMLRSAVTLLEGRPDLRSAVRREYRHVCVDEYQDMNPLQEALLRALAGEGVTVSAIGDPDQAIYGFRGSDASVLGRFPDTFTPCRLLRLTVNYRSAPCIVRGAVSVMARGARTALSADPVPGPDIPGEIRCHPAATARAEAAAVAAAINRLTGGSGFDNLEPGGGGEYGFGDIAVLYRLNAQADVLAEALAEAGIPHRVYGPAADPGGPEDVYEARAEKVSLMTLHAAKGLEFPAVLIAGCDTGLLPLAAGDRCGDPEEERRLFYVGMTRARRFLGLFSAPGRMLWGLRLPGVVSPFLEDIPVSLRVQETPKPLSRRRARARKQMTLW